jgi:hypothetical protein
LLIRGILSRLMTMRMLKTVFTFNTVLMIVYNEVMDASEAARGTDFNVEKKVLARKFRSNILKQFFYLLSDFLVMSSAEAMELARSKTRSRSSSPKKKARTSKAAGEQGYDSIPVSETIPTSQSSRLNFALDNTPATPVGNKRVFSNEFTESYGFSSTETTPTKITHTESLTQSLQNALIGALIGEVWLGGPEIPWAKGRKMCLDYRPYLPDLSN